MIARPNDRRDDILRAGLALFLARGYDATSIADIRAASGASTGSIYHFFPGKGAIAHALLKTAVAGWSAAAPETIDPAAGAESSVKAAVRALVTWGERNLDLLRFMDEVRTRAESDPDFAETRRMLDAGQVAARARYEAMAKAGDVRPMPWPLAHSLMLGPAYNYLRLIGIRPPAVRGAAAALADAAWAAVRRA